MYLLDINSSDLPLWVQVILIGWSPIVSQIIEIGWPTLAVRFRCGISKITGPIMFLYLIEILKFS